MQGKLRKYFLIITKIVHIVVVPIFLVSNGLSLDQIVPRIDTFSNRHYYFSVAGITWSHMNPLFALFSQIKSDFFSTNSISQENLWVRRFRPFKQSSRKHFETKNKTLEKINKRFFPNFLWTNDCFIIFHIKFPFK